MDNYELVGPQNKSTVCNTLSSSVIGHRDELVPWLVSPRVETRPFCEAIYPQCSEVYLHYIYISRGERAVLARGNKRIYN